ncbi:hypothetical protein [Sinorhizobium americanum]|uniref:hypothetical protein n=1 Tax=Sinorhizobium americanum TaxID=194963 RepID=UPI00142D3F07
MDRTPGSPWRDLPDAIGMAFSVPTLSTVGEGAHLTVLEQVVRRPRLEYLIVDETAAGSTSMGLAQKGNSKSGHRRSGGGLLATR